MNGSPGAGDQTIPHPHVRTNHNDNWPKKTVTLILPSPSIKSNVRHCGDDNSLPDQKPNLIQRKGPGAIRPPPSLISCIQNQSARQNTISYAPSKSPLEP